ncbi:hypothetical protein V2J09_023141 [Rumex salicifolius]
MFQFHPSSSLRPFRRRVASRIFACRQIVSVRRRDCLFNLHLVTPAWSCSLFVILSPVRRRETKSLPRSRF